MSFKQSKRVGTSAFALLLMCSTALTGCGLRMGGWFASGRFRQPCQLPRNVGKQQLVEYLNQNIHRVHAWRATNVQISAPGMPVPLSAVLAVERPRRFRLRAGSILAGNEVDLGSNDERFWFWMKRSPQQGVVTATHENAHRVQEATGVPFQPDWLMEALGVIPLDADEYVMQAPSNGLISLVSQRTTASGQQVQRVVLVDTCHGRVVAHELRDNRNRLIARAELNDYRYYRSARVAMPHEIHLDWPRAGTALTISLRAIEVNPPGMPEPMWQLPTIPGHTVTDLGARSAPEATPGRSWVRSIDGEPSTTDVQVTGWQERRPATLTGDLEVTAEAPRARGRAERRDRIDRSQSREADAPSGGRRRNDLVRPFWREPPGTRVPEEPPWDEASR